MVPRTMADPKLWLVAYAAWAVVWLLLYIMKWVGLGRLTRETTDTNTLRPRLSAAEFTVRRDLIEMLPWAIAVLIVAGIVSLAVPAAVAAGLAIATIHPLVWLMRVMGIAQWVSNTLSAIIAAIVGGVIVLALDPDFIRAIGRGLRSFWAGF